MKKIVITAALLASSLFASQAFASACEDKAGEKKLAGAAKTSHVKKCMEDSKMPAAAAAPAASGAKK